MKFTRREILTAFLGLPFALAACQSNSETRKFPDGEIVGANVDVGHILRENRNVRSSRAIIGKTSKVAIVGGGAAGLDARLGNFRKRISTISFCSNSKTEIGGTARAGKVNLGRLSVGRALSARSVSRKTRN